MVVVDLRERGSTVGPWVAPLYGLIVGFIGLAVRSGRSKDLEIVVLGHQLAVL